MAEIGLDWEELDRDMERRRRRSRKLAELELRDALRNTDGLDKLLDISDEDWAAAQELDAEVEGA